MRDCSFGFEQFHLKHQNVLRSLLEKIKNPEPHILEIGCWTGQSTNVICKFLKEKTGGSLTVIDTFEGVVDTPLDPLAKQHNIIEIFMDNMMLENNIPWPLQRVLKKRSQDVASFFDDETFDLIFIDGDHRYEMVKQDILLYLPKMKRGGIICGHDYDSSYFDEGLVNYDFKEGKHHGVIKAVQEIFHSPLVDVKAFEHDFVFWFSQEKIK